MPMSDGEQSDQPGRRGLKRNQLAAGWIAIGAGVGAALGVALGNIAIGVAIGAGVGVAIMAAMTGAANKK